MRAFLINSLPNSDTMAVFSCHLAQINHVILEVEGKRNQVPPVLPERNGYIITDKYKTTGGVISVFFILRWHQNTPFFLSHGIISLQINMDKFQSTVLREKKKLLKSLTSHLHEVQNQTKVNHVIWYNYMVLKYKKIKSKQ